MCVTSFYEGQILQIVSKIFSISGSDTTWLPECPSDSDGVYWTCECTPSELDGHSGSFPVISSQVPSGWSSLSHSVLYQLILMGFNLWSAQKFSSTFGLKTMHRTEENLWTDDHVFSLRACLSNNLISAGSQMDRRLQTDRQTYLQYTLTYGGWIDGWLQTNTDL